MLLESGGDRVSIYTRIAFGWSWQQPGAALLPGAAFRLFRCHLLILLADALQQDQERLGRVDSRIGLQPINTLLPALLCGVKSCPACRQNQATANSEKHQCLQKQKKDSDGRPSHNLNPRFNQQGEQ